MGASVVSQELSSFTYSNVTELYNQWLPGTTYSFEESEPYTNAGAVLHRNFYWRSTSTSNIGNEPIDENGNKSSEWIVLSPANLSSILDLSSNSKCTITGGDLILEFTKTYKIQTLVIGRFMGLGLTVEYLDAINTVLKTDIYDYTDEQFNNIYDDITYDYASLDDEVDRNKLIRLQFLGEKIRLTLQRNNTTDTAYISFLTAGEEYELGKIDGSIDRTDASYADRTYNAISGTTIDTTVLSQNYSFSLLVPRLNQVEIKRKGESLKSKTNTYILDNRETSEFENFIVLGQLTSASDSTGNADFVSAKWTVEESI